MASDPDKSVVSNLDLPFELLLDIFTQLDLTSAISVAKTHPYNREVVDDMMRRLLSNRTLEIVGCACMISGIHYKPRHARFGIIMDLLKYFSHHITKLNVQFNRLINKTQHETLNEYISKYGATSLKEIDLQFEKLYDTSFIERSIPERGTFATWRRYYSIGVQS